MRNLLYFVLALVGIWWMRRALQRKNSGQGGARREAGPAAPAGPERMLACTHCGVHVPESEGLRVGEAFYCCDAHRRAHGD